MQLIDFYEKREAREKFTDADFFRLAQKLLLQVEANDFDGIIKPSLVGYTTGQIILDDIMQSDAVPYGYLDSVNTWRNSVW